MRFALHNDLRGCSGFHDTAITGSGNLKRQHKVVANIWIERPDQTDADACYLGAVSRDTKTWNWVTGESVDMTLWSGRNGPDNPHPSAFGVIVWTKGGNHYLTVDESNEG